MRQRDRQKFEDYIKVVTKAQEILKKMGWCRGDEAINKHGKQTKPTSPDADKFCALGSIRLASYLLNKKGTISESIRNSISDFMDLQNKYKGPTGEHYSLISYNDLIAKNKTQIISLFEKYKKHLKEKLKVS